MSDFCRKNRFLTVNRTFFDPDFIITLLGSNKITLRRWIWRVGHLVQGATTKTRKGGNDSTFGESVYGRKNRDWRYHEYGKGFFYEKFKIAFFEKNLSKASSRMSSRSSASRLGRDGDSQVSNHISKKSNFCDTLHKFLKSQIRAWRKNEGEMLEDNFYSIGWIYQSKMMKRQKH